MLEVIRGYHSKPVISNQLFEYLKKIGLEGILYLGYPILPGLDRSFEIDAMLVSKEYGIVIFDLFENSLSEDRLEYHDDIVNSLTSKLLQNKKLRVRRALKVNINIMTFAPRWSDYRSFRKEDFEFDFANSLDEIESKLPDFKWEDNEYYNKLLQAIQAITTIKNTPKRLKVKSETSKGAILKSLEDSIANLDSSQNRAVLETADGVQRIRGLAGSGKTIVLALKVAYLHVTNPEWRIAVTFNTRSLKDQFQNLVNRFVYEHTFDSPNWKKIDIIHAWGSSNSKGIYHSICLNNGLGYYDYGSAKSQCPSGSDVFEWACKTASEEMDRKKQKFKELYDLILIDEAQDFSNSFLKLCYEILSPEKRLIYAYDELQNLNTNSVDSPEEIFGKNSIGKPNVELRNIDGQAKQDIILDVCYRNPRPILISAHALGFGIYSDKGLIQLFDESSLWKDIGYQVIAGELCDDSHVVLERNNLSSPSFLESHSTIDEIIKFEKFDDSLNQAKWVAKEIKENLSNDELEFQDIMVIHSNPYTTRRDVISLRKELEKLGIQSHLAGVNTSPDKFFEEDSITITSIYRAKGNEASIVYFIDADHCYEGVELAKKRNILFTAMTRSKAWLRVTGCGEKMEGLIEEYEKIKEYDYKLDFTYPNESERNRINLIHRDKTRDEKMKIDGTVTSLEAAIQSIMNEEVMIEDIPEDLLKKIKKVISNG